MAFDGFSCRLCLVQALGNSVTACRGHLAIASIADGIALGRGRGAGANGTRGLDRSAASTVPLTTSGRSQIAIKKCQMYSNVFKQQVLLRLYF